LDTLEIRNENGVGQTILWKNRDAKQVCREQHPDMTLHKTYAAPKSLRADAQYCDYYSLKAPEGKISTGQIYLVEIQK
jgi:hypothetical protein